VKHVWAYTPSEVYAGYVPFVNLSKDTKTGEYVLTVRTGGSNVDTSFITLNALKLNELAMAILGETINASED